MNRAAARPAKHWMWPISETPAKFFICTASWTRRSVRMLEVRMSK